MESPADSTPPRSTTRFTLIPVGEAPARGAFADDVRAGLTRAEKRLPCRYFYDAEGSQLFEAICEQPEYYLLRAERAILERHADTIANRYLAGTTLPVELVELGSGSAEKTHYLIEAFLRRQKTLRYVPIDVSRSALEQSAEDLLGKYPNLSVHALMGDYGDALDALTRQDRAHHETRSRLILWLGSSIGNLERDAAARFLDRIRRNMASHDALFIGFDLRKDASVLEPAYDDAQGVTARFNLNVLRRINQELGANFDLNAFEHRAVYEADAGRVAMYLVSRRAQEVHIPALSMTVPLRADEAIHTEYSHKYRFEEIGQLASAAGLSCLERWTDTDERFVDVLLAPR